MNKYLVIITAVLCVLSGVLYQLKILPNIPVPQKGVSFYFQCNNASAERKVLSYPSTAEGYPSFPKGQYWFVVIPGYTESSFRKWVKFLAHSLLEAKPSACVLFVDHWNYLSLSRPYMTLNVKKIARDVVDLLVHMEKNEQLRTDSLHVIGFSLGGWVAGTMANYLPKGKKIHRITGIDPSFPWSDTDDPSDFLDSGDAESVVVIRTSKVSLKVPPVNLDFHVNGGQIQPECDVWWYPDFVQQICSHYIAPFLFANSLRENVSSFSYCGCPSRESLLSGICPCDVKNSFGLNTLLKQRGNFYFESSINQC